MIEDAERRASDRGRSLEALGRSLGEQFPTRAERLRAAVALLRLVLPPGFTRALALTGEGGERLAYLVPPGPWSAGRMEALRRRAAPGRAARPLPDEARPAAAPDA